MYNAPEHWHHCSAPLRGIRARIDLQVLYQSLSHKAERNGERIDSLGRNCNVQVVYPLLSKPFRSAPLELGNVQVLYIFYGDILNTLVANSKFKLWNLALIRTDLSIIKNIGRNLILECILDTKQYAWTNYTKIILAFWIINEVSVLIDDSKPITPSHVEVQTRDALRDIRPVCMSRCRR